MMRIVERLGLAALHRLDPERAHDLAMACLSRGIAPRYGTPTGPRLSCTIAGLNLPNPIGLAAGFDKNARAVNALLGAGFGFVEVGAATPHAQPGNPRPRLFRLSEAQAIINRFGFNNDGMEAIAARLAQPRRTGVVGLNLGANKDSDDKAADFATVLTAAAAHIDFATVNVSSPNTERLRDLQGRAALTAVLDRVLTARAGLDHPIPVFVKVAPDMTPDQLDDVAEVALASDIDGIFATNTTLSREGVTGPHRDEAGGLSGPPLRARALSVLAELSARIDGALPLVGIGGITTVDDVLDRIDAGASAVQIYSSVIYHGLGHGARLARQLDARLAAEGAPSIATRIGSARARWLNQLDGLAAQ